VVFRSFLHPASGLLLHWILDALPGAKPESSSTFAHFRICGLKGLSGTTCSEARIYDASASEPMVEWPTDMLLTEIFDWNGN
jgi:hypothetical protein